MIECLFEVAETSTDPGVLQLNVVLDDQKASRFVIGICVILTGITLYDELLILEKFNNIDLFWKT